MPPEKFDVFLSYHWPHHAQVETLARSLCEHRLTVFLDRWYLTPGQSWPKALEATLAQCGAVAFCIGQGEMGPWQQRELYLALERQVAAERRGQRFPVIPILLPGAEPPLGFLSQNTWIDFRSQIADPVLLNTLVRAIHGEPPGPDVLEMVHETLATICPYRGLLYFREEDAPFFFGRTEAITQLVHAVQQHNLIAVVGASGSGKSSVVRAGLMPALRASREPVWELTTFVPTDRPLYALVALLMPLLESDMREVTRLIEMNKLVDALLQGTVKLRDLVDRLLTKQPGTDRLLLIVDQWEELFTLCQDVEARRCFIDNVLDATATAKLSVVLTLRGDFFGRAITAYRPLSDRVQGAQVNLGPMKREELRLAIQEPARQVGLTFEAGLIDLILEQAGDEPGHLPLLEFVLRRLWEDRRGGELHHEAYKAMGQLDGAIAKKAESLYVNLTEENQQRVQQIFLRLVRPGEGEVDTRRRAIMVEVGEEMRGLAKMLTDERLLVTSRPLGSAEETIEVSHEALIRHWQRLKRWVDADRQFLIWQQRLRASIEQYEESKGRSDFLLRGFPLTEAVDWLKKKPDYFLPRERQFVTTSKTRQVRRRWAAVTVGGLVFVVILGMDWLWQKGYSVEQAVLKIQSFVVSIHIAPEMQPVPAGTLDQVSIKPFAIGKFEVTFEEYDRFAIEMNQPFPGDQTWGRGRHPVINVSWDDAKAYTQWLSKRTGKSYRLPTEIEWEYAARSGGQDQIWAGTSDNTQLEQYAVYMENSQTRTAPVGEKKPNGLGLYDMSGNVLEWVQDCAGKRTKEEECRVRAIRGGSWSNGPQNLRASHPRGLDAGYVGTDQGFRLAQDVPQ
jgi:hypothetical protein